MSEPTGIARVDAFLSRLGRLAWDDWLAIGRIEAACGPVSGERRTAELLAEAIVAHRALQVPRWYALDAVDTWASLAGAGRRAQPAPVRGLLESARQAVRRAVVAVLASPDLTPPDLALLCQPLNAMPALRSPRRTP